MNTQNEARFAARLARDTLALVMAGGRGSRLMQLTDARAKPAVAFGGNYRIIDFTLSNCINSGIRRVGVLTQYQGCSLIRHLQTAWSFLRGQLGEGVELLPAEQRAGETGWYAGTADAVYRNLDFVREHLPRYVLVLAGDHVYKMDYGSMLAQHARTGARITVGALEVPIGEASAFGVMRVDGTRVTAFDEKPLAPVPVPGRRGAALASMGIYVFDTEFLIQWLGRDAQARDSSHDFGRDVVPAAIRRNVSVHAFGFADLHDRERPGYWRDVGTVDAYYQTNLELAGVTPELNLYDRRWPMLGEQSPLPPAKFVFDRPSMRGSAADSLVSAGCIVSGARVRNSLLFTEARVETGSIVERSLLLPRVSIGRGCRIRRAIIDEGCMIPDGFVVGEDRQRDRECFHLSEGGVVLVTRAMLERSAAAMGFQDVRDVA